MKKLYAMLAAAVAVSFSANAQLEYTEVTLANPSFEEAVAEGEDPHPVSANLKGWEAIGDGWFTAEGAVSNFAAFQTHTKNPTHGNVVLRSGAAPDVSNTYIKQTLLSQPLGTYVLIFDGQATRGSKWQGTFTENQWAYAFVIDDEGDPEDEGTAEEPSLGGSFLHIDAEPSTGNWFTCGWRHYVVHTTHPDLEDETGIAIGFGVPASSEAITKCQISCDNFQLRYYNTMDTEAVVSALKDEIEAWAATGYHNVNAVNGWEKDLVGAVANFDLPTQGVNDITVAPVVEGNNKYYNLQGIEVADPTQPGLYIHNGKKILVK